MTRTTNPTTSPGFSVEEFAAWVRTKPARERYDVNDAGHCALGQFGKATGRQHLVECFDPDRVYPGLGLNDALGFNKKGELTFGALASRLQALLPDTPSVWVSPDA